MFIFHLLIPFSMESPIIRASFLFCLRLLLFIWSWLAVFIFDCNKLSTELLLKLSSIFSTGASLMRVTKSMQNQCHYLFYYFYFIYYFILLKLFVSVIKELSSWRSIFRFCRFKLFNKNYKRNFDFEKFFSFQQLIFLQL